MKCPFRNGADCDSDCSLYLVNWTHGGTTTQSQCAFTEIAICLNKIAYYQSVIKVTNPGNEYLGVMRPSD